MPGIFDPNVFDEDIFDTLFWRIIKDVVTLQFARKTRILDFVDKERTLFLSAKLRVLDFVEKLKTLKLAERGTTLLITRIALDNPTVDGVLGRSASSEVSCPEGRLRGFTTVDSCDWGGGKFGVEYLAYRSYVEWDISSIPKNATIVSVVFRYHGKAVGATASEINPLTEEQPSEAANADIWEYIASGTAYVDPFNVELGTDKEIDLGSLAVADLQSALGTGDWFAIGFQSPDDECSAEDLTESRIYAEEYATVDPPPTLYIEYLT